MKLKVVLEPQLKVVEVIVMKKLPVTIAVKTLK